MLNICGAFLHLMSRIEFNIHSFIKMNDVGSYDVIHQDDWLDPREGSGRGFEQHQ